MAIISRILSVVLGIIISAAGILLILLTFGVFDWATLQYIELDFVLLIGNYNYTILGFVLLIVGLLIIALFASKRSKKQDKSIESYTEMGELRISFKAIENMVITASKKIKGLRDVSTHIKSGEQGLIIYLRILPLPDIAIPPMVNDLQEKVHEYVENISGAAVAEVKVSVEDIAQSKILKPVR